LIQPSSFCQRGLGDSVFAAVERALQLGHPSEESRVTPAV
jgi:hypothetical protein